MGLDGSIGISWFDVSTIIMDSVVSMGDGGSRGVISAAQRSDFGKGSSRGWWGVGDVEACIMNGVFERLGHVRGGEARGPGTDSLRSHVSEDARLLGSETRAPVKKRKNKLEDTCAGHNLHNSKRRHLRSLGYKKKKATVGVGGGGGRRARNPNPNRALRKKKKKARARIRGEGHRRRWHQRFGTRRGLLGGVALRRTRAGLPAYSLRPPPTAAEIGRHHALKEIKQKKEELFSLIADTERRYNTRLTKEDFQNIRMLQQLAVQIDPRPADPLWRSKRFTKRLNDFVGFTGAIVSGYLLTDKWLNSGKDADPRGEEGMALAASQQ
ncbi:uncharacterized protein [Triticum aestivum]|uniref:uncharacterized protein n=1 Tax=Triticum aestivum TaxID=4565 RepID=UPI001D0133D6|nr:uncharacterized protein LOC123158238 [Triticum aestivum]